MNQTVIRELRFMIRLQLELCFIRKCLPMKKANVNIELRGQYTYGASVMDFMDQEHANCGDCDRCGLG